MQFNKDNYVKYFNIACWIYVIAYILQIVANIGYVSCFFNDGDLSVDNLLKYRGKIFQSHQQLIMIPLLTGIWVLFFKRINLMIFACLLFINNYFNLYHVSDVFVHPYVFQLYKNLGGERQFLNPQYTRVVLYTALIIFLLFQSIFKNQRTTDRIFVTISVCLVFLTVSIFHMGIASGSFKYERELEKTKLSWELNNLKDEDVCKLHENCVVWYPDPKYDVLKYDEKLTQYLMPEVSYFVYKFKANQDKFDFEKELSILKNSDNLFILIGAKRIKTGNKDNILFVVDDKILQKYGYMGEMWFAYLCAWAHLIWGVLFLGLLIWHKNKIKR